MATGLTADALFRLKAHNGTAVAFDAAGKGLEALNRQADKMDKLFGDMKGFKEFQRMAAGFLGGGAILGGIKSVISAGDEIGDMADATGFGVESIQSLMIVANDAGVRLDRLKGTINLLQGKMEEARVEGGEKLAAAFAKLGVSAEMLASGNTEAVFEQIAMAMRAGAGDATVTAAAHDVLGASVEKLAPILRAAAEGMAALNKEMIDNGEIMSKSEVGALSRADRTLQRFGNKTKVAVAGGLENAGAYLEGAGAFWRTGGDRKAVEQAQMDYFSGISGGRAELRPRGFQEPKGPSNFVEQASQNEVEALAKQDAMVTLLDKIAGHMARIERNQGRGVGPIGP